MWKKLIITAAMAAAGAAQAATQTEGFENLTGLNANNNNSGVIASQDPGSFDWSTTSGNNLQLLTLARAASASKGLTGITSETSLGNWVGFLNSSSNVSFAAKASAGFTAFNFDSAVFYAKNAGTLTIVGTLASGGSVSYSLALGAASLVSFTDSGLFDNVTKITFSGTDVAFDNVTTTSLAPVTAVPEVSGLSMLLAGLGVLGVTLRRRSI